MENSKQTRRPGWLPNLFDLVIIAIVIVCGVVFLWLTGAIGGGGGGGEAPETGSASGSHNLRYIIELTQMYGDTAQLIREGDVIVDGVRKYEMGTVVSVDVADSTTYSHDMESGTYRQVTVPGYQTATVVLESECTESATEIMVDGGYLIRCGVSVQVRGPGYAGTGTIVSIERGSQG